MNRFTYLNDLLVDSGLHATLGDINWLFYLKKTDKLDFSCHEEADVASTLFDLQDNLTEVLVYAQPENHNHTKYTKQP